jgi:hypothetical protein
MCRCPDPAAVAFKYAFSMHWINTLDMACSSEKYFVTKLLVEKNRLMLEAYT